MRWSALRACLLYHTLNQAETHPTKNSPQWPGGLVSRSRSASMLKTIMQGNS